MALTGNEMWLANNAIGGGIQPISASAVSALIGTGSTSYSQIARKIAMSLPSQLTAVVDGDSITIGNSGYFNGVPTYGVTSYINNALFGAGRYTLLNNGGVAGQNSAAMLAALPTAVLSYNPNVCVILIGINDLVLSPINSSYSNLMNNLEKVVIKLLDNSILPVLVTIPPNNTNFLMAKRLQWFYYKLAAYYGIPLIDIYKIWADPTTGEYQSGYTSDGGHPNTTAIAAAQSAIISVLQNINNPTQYLYSGTVAEQATNDPSNLIGNGTFDYGPMNFWSENTNAYTYTNPAAVYPYTGNQVQAVSLNDGSAYILSGSTFNVVGGHTYYGFVRWKLSGEDVTTANIPEIVLLANVSSNLFITSCYNLDVPYAFQWVAPLTETGYTPQFFSAGDALNVTHNINNFTVVDVTAQNAIWQPGQQNIL